MMVRDQYIGNEESEANIKMKVCNFDDEKRAKCTKFAFSELNGRALRNRLR